MSAEAYNFELCIDGDYIIVKWRQKPDAVPAPRYEEFDIRFNYRDISRDTVRAMLTDMQVPASASKAIMTRITASPA